MNSAYQILPAPPPLFPGHRPYPANWNLYDAAAWHIDGIRQDYLDLGRQFHETLAAAPCKDPPPACPSPWGRGEFPL